MQIEQELRFGPYQLDLEHGQVWRGKQTVKLTPKALAILRQLVHQAGQVVSKEELFQTVWPETVVSEAALTVCVQELRRVLRDNATHPRYIETVHRRGFRFIGKVVSSQHSVVSSGELSDVRRPASTILNLHSAIRLPPPSGGIPQSI